MPYVTSGVNTAARSADGAVGAASGETGAAPTEGRANGTVDIQSVARAADVLRALAASPDGLSLAQISSVVRLSRSTVHRIVLALVRQDFVRSTESGYRLGPGLLRLAEASRSSFEVDIHHHLTELSAELNETVDLSVMTGQAITFVDQIVARRRLRAVSGIGVSFPLHCTANGKAVLAALPPGSLDELLPPRLERFTPATHVDREALGRELDEVRERGIAFDREEHTVGICAVGMALRAPDGSWHAVSVPLPATRFYGHEERLATALHDAYRRMVGEPSAAAAEPRRARRRAGSRG